MSRPNHPIIVKQFLIYEGIRLKLISEKDGKFFWIDGTELIPSETLYIELENRIYARCKEQVFQAKQKDEDSKGQRTEPPHHPIPS